ncbi:MAG: hypothetical protein JWO36_4073, partial [Myxococcales bacterium]|nr:hypothetical protein [Myxococcales bacterium]
MNQAIILIALGCVLGAGCKPKEKAPSQAKSGLAALSGMTTAPATADGLIVVGTPKLGCFAWSTARHTAACVTGWQAPGNGELSLNYLDATAGAPPSTPINFAGDIDATEARTNNEALAAGGFASLSTLPAPR